MKVLNVIWSIGKRNGGTTESCVRLSAELISRGHTVDYLVFDPDTSGLGEERQTRVFRLRSVLGVYAYAPELLRWLRGNVSGYDIVVVHGIWQYMSIGVYFALKRASVPFVVFPHGGLGSWFKVTYPAKHVKKLIYWILFEYWVLKRARRVFFASEGERIDARRSFFVYDVVDRVVPFGTAVKPVGICEAKYWISSNYPELASSKIVLVVGRLHPVKGIDIVIDAFAFARKVDVALKLVFVGADPNCFWPSLESKARRLGVEDHVCWIGLQDSGSLACLYRSAAVVCLPSHHENFGMAAVEAVGHGVPLIISNKFKIFEVLLNERAAIVCDDSVSSLSEAMLRWLALDDKALEEMKLAQERCFKMHFRSEGMGDAYEYELNAAIMDDSNV